jgi:hypothetical protein
MPLAGHPAAGRNRLDRTWLEPIAAVRPAAARVEAYQLEALVRDWPRLRAWSNWPGNPWRQGVAVPPAGAGPAPPSLVVVYAPQDALTVPPATELATLVIDGWTETIPSEAHTVTAAFGFNAPASRAPQAVLVAVTPVDGAPLDTATLLDIVSETRELAHARMASPTDLHALAAALPFSLVQSRHSDLAGVELADWERS